MSEFRSFGPNCFPSSQSRKISIGVMADALGKRNPESNKDDGNALPRVEKLNSATAKDLEMNKKDEGSSAANRRNPARATGHVSSPWRSPRSSYRRLGTLENVLSKQTSSLSDSKGLWKGLNEVNQAPTADSVQKLPVSALQSSDCKPDNGRKKGKDGIAGRMEELASVASQEKVASGGGGMDKPDEAKNGSTEALRTKLWEILGKSSSPKNQHLNSEAAEVVDNNLHLGQDKDPNGDPLVKHTHNSDSIDTDSESPEGATRRPVTRSLLPKRVSAKGAQKKTKAGANLVRNQKEQEKNIFSFEEGLQGKTSPVINFGSMPKKQKTRRKKTVIQRHKVQSLENDEADGILRETNNSETPPPSENVRTDKTSSFSNRKGSLCGFPPQNNAQLQKPQSDIREEDFHQSQATGAATKPGVLHGLSESGDKHEGPSNPFMEKPVEPLNDFHSPTLGYRTPMLSPSPCLSPAATPLFPRDNCPALEESETPMFSFGTKKTSQTACQASNAERELSDLSENSRDFCYARESSAELNEDSEGLSESSSDERDSNGSGQDSPAMGYYDCSEERGTSPRGSRRKSKFAFHPAKRNSDPKGRRLGEPSPTLSSQKGIHKADCFPGSSELNGDDGLGRVITFFALALQNFEKKLKSAARKKSSEIIASVSEEIHLQMENVESHILTDVGKLSNLTKTKRKHAETRVQEQQEKLRMIHEKFKDDVSHHLEDFKSTIEGLEANQTELKGTIKRQKASHQKLIAELEGEVETQLVDASRRIKAVNEGARAKMVQLKKIVAECLKDDDMIW